MSGLKKTIKKITNIGSIPPIKVLTKKVKKYENVSFDIFDTLLKRKVNDPKDVFQLMELTIQNEIPNFQKKRIEAENKARLINNSKEITLTDIYNCFQGINIQQKKKLEKLELKFEENILVPNKPIVDLFNICKQLKKRIYIISDMYLPLNFINNILKKCGITEYKKIYLSSNDKLTKKSGLLFDLYLRQNKLAPEKCIHIGDDWISDYDVPKRKGISAIHVPRLTNFVKNKPLNEQYINNFINLNIENKSVKDPYYKFGYQKFGKFLWGYVKWLHKNFQDKKLKKIFFFSRDGYIMKKAYDLLYHNVQDNIKDSYLEVSRRSLRVPILWLNSSFGNYINMISPSKLITIQSFFDGAGLDISKYQDLLKKYDLKKESSFDRKEVLSNIKLKKLYSALLPDIIQKSKNEYNLLQLYLKQERVYGRFAIVDIGWGGSMERYLTQTLNALKIPHDIYGYYIGVADYYKKNVQSFPLNMKGYLFDFKNNKVAVDKRSSFVGLFESLFLEQDGSVEKYTKKGGKIIANRYSYEYLKNGKPTFELLSVRKIQNGALDFIKDIQKDFILSNLLYFNSNELYHGIWKTGTQPNKSDLKMFANFHFYDEGRVDKLAAPQKIMIYLKNPRKLKRDFLVSRWKIGFMKEILKVKFPYQKLYLFMRKFK